MAVRLVWGYLAMLRGGRIAGIAIYLPKIVPPHRERAKFSGLLAWQSPVGGAGFADRSRAG